MEATPDVEEDELEETLEVAKFDLFKIGVGVILHLADIVFDVYAAIEIYYHSSSEFFAAAIIFIIVPAVITNLISWLCYHDDNNSSVSTGIIHMLLLGQIKRVIDLFRFAVKLLQGKIQSTKNAMIKFNSWYADVAMIGMIEALLESDPQAILQLSRIIPGNPDDNFNFGVKRTLSAIFSFISVGFAIASYHVTIRKPQSQKKKICKKGYLIHWIWHLMITASRLISMACLLTVCPCAVLIGGGIHVLIAVVFLHMPGKGPERTFSSIWKELGLRLLIAFAYLFYAIPVRDGSSRNFYLFMYFIFFFENVASTTYWYFQLSNNLALIVLILPLCSFFVGICFMLMYYSYFHPSKTVRKSLPPYSVVHQSVVPQET